MASCHRCGKPVYFAERRTSLGKDWHRECLRCEECGKVLHPGQHAEHRGIPYCHTPCYSALFGPTVYGHGSPIEAHRHFGRGMETEKRDSPKKRADIHQRVKAYNRYHEGSSSKLKTREVNGRLVLEGPLRVYWHVACQIQLKPKDDSAPSTPKSVRRSYQMAIGNGLEEEILSKLDSPDDTLKGRPSFEKVLVENDLNETPSAPTSPRKSNGIAFNGVHLRDKSATLNRRQKLKKRRSVINGHFFDLDTSVFTPTSGTVTNVRVSSLDRTQEVITALMHKYKVLNNPNDFCLCAVKLSGEQRLLRESDYPLIERVLMGPLEGEAQIFIYEKGKVGDISEEIARYMSLPDPVLDGFLVKLEEDEELESKQIKKRYKRIRQEMEKRLEILASESGKQTRL